jgi:hypothetical protein
MSTVLKLIVAIVVIPAYMALYFCLLLGNWLMDKFMKERT